MYEIEWIEKAREREREQENSKNPFGTCCTFHYRSRYIAAFFEKIKESPHSDILCQYLYSKEKSKKRERNQRKINKKKRKAKKIFSILGLYSHTIE